MAQPPFTTGTKTGDKENDWYVYVVLCSDKTLYCGIAKGDVHRRVREHNHGKVGAKYTRSRRPVMTLAYWAFTGERARSLAAKAEYHFKKFTKAKKVQVLLHEPEELAHWYDYTFYPKNRDLLNGA